MSSNEYASWTPALRSIVMHLLDDETPGHDSFNNMQLGFTPYGTRLTIGKWCNDQIDPGVPTETEPDERLKEYDMHKPMKTLKFFSRDLAGEKYDFSKKFKNADFGGGDQTSLIKKDAKPEKKNKIIANFKPYYGVLTTAGTNWSRFIKLKDLLREIHPSKFKNKSE